MRARRISTSWLPGRVANVELQLLAGRLHRAHLHQPLGEPLGQAVAVDAHHLLVQQHHPSPPPARRGAAARRQRGAGPAPPCPRPSRAPGRPRRWPAVVGGVGRQARDVPAQRRVLRAAAPAPAAGAAMPRGQVPGAHPHAAPAPRAGWPRRAGGRSPPAAPSRAARGDRPCPPAGGPIRRHEAQLRAAGGPPRRAGRWPRPDRPAAGPRAPGPGPGRRRSGGAAKTAASRPRPPCAGPATPGSAPAPGEPGPGCAAPRASRPAGAAPSPAGPRSCSSDASASIGGSAAGIGGQRLPGSGPGPRSAGAARAPCSPRPASASARSAGLVGPGRLLQRPLAVLVLRRPLTQQQQRAGSRPVPRSRAPGHARSPWPPDQPRATGSASARSPARRRWRPAPGPARPGRRRIAPSSGAVEQAPRPGATHRRTRPAEPCRRPADGGRP